MEEKELKQAKPEEKKDNPANRKITNEEFGHIMDVIKKSKASIPLEYVLSILGGIVTDSDKNSSHVKEVAELFRDRPVEEAVASSVLFTCNSVVINIWNLFGHKLEQLAQENVLKAEAAEDVKDVNA